MKQTAVEWLVENLDIIWEEKIIDLVEQAKAMEKEQIIDAASDHCYPNRELATIDAEQYYNKTFKSESLGLKNWDVTLNDGLENEPYVSDDFQIGPDGAYEHTDEENTLTPKEIEKL